MIKISMKTALGNAKNASALYAKRGESVTIEIVANSGGLNMFREDTSPVKQQIAELRKVDPSVVFSACNNTKITMEKPRGKADHDNSRSAARAGWGRANRGKSRSRVMPTCGREALGHRPLRVQPIFISVDPQRDTPKILREYVNDFNVAHLAADRNGR